ncbi:hypothetical protein I8748_25690 [Nostoc sp. CENA67]|uniref:Uncharacterized protein n=1 Tax=Amazonocrinis nigriterrae CENA67 TaxID=2794033 RepID=A0A8J7HTQ2_9NOST|nr:hypothetical protein [Amazonocrinis nigriterrae]MBH8565527.1 hypothetical protein [Amazonocrinis nigriterrae CENA67]
MQITAVFIYLDHKFAFFFALLQRQLLQVGKAAQRTASPLREAQNDVVH